MTTWKFGSTTLETFGRVTIVNDYLDLTNRRGGNITIPQRHGSVFAEKFYGERKLTLGVAVIAASATALETAFDTLRALLSPRTQQTLEMTMTDASVRNVQACVDSSLQVQRKSDKIALTTIEFTLCEPFFRSNTAIADNTTTINSSPKAMTVTNTGTVEERDPTIIIHGAFTSLTITNSTNGASLTYTGTIGTSETVTIGTLNGEFYATLSTGSANVIGNVTHSGSSALLPLNVGANTLSITNAGRDGNSTVKITFYPPYL
jgi:phage-related protein